MHARAKTKELESLPFIHLAMIRCEQSGTETTSDDNIIMNSWGTRMKNKFAKFTHTSWLEAELSAGKVIRVPVISDRASHKFSALHKL